MNQRINSTLAYVNMVNESSYLIYYPNLTQAYDDINQAKNASITNPPRALSLLSQAHQSAQQQLNTLNSEKQTAEITTGVFSFIVGILLLFSMRAATKVIKKK